MISSSKILFISTNSGFGGSEVLWVQMLAKFRQDKYEVACIIHPWNKLPEEIKALKETGRVFVRQPQPLNSLLDKVLIKSKLQKRWVDDLVERTCESFKPDLVVISIGDHSTPELSIICNQLKKSNSKYVILVQLATEYRDIDDGASQRLLESYVGAEKCYFLCTKNQRVVENHIGAKLANAAFFQSPFDINRLKSNSFLYEGASDVYNIGMVTNFNIFHKGHDLIFEALGNANWKNRKFHLNIFGYGANQNLIERLIKTYHLEDKVSLLGFVNAAEDIWRKNQACLFVSRMEGQSLAMLDAISLNRMVIATDVGDAENLIDDGITGFVIPFPEAKAVLDTLELAWEKREQWLEMGEKGKEKMKAIFSKDPVDSMIYKLQQLINP